MPYFASGVALAAIELLFAQGSLPRAWKTCKYQMLTVFRIQNEPFPLPFLNSKDIEKYCQKLLDVLDSESSSKAAFQMAGELVEETRRAAGYSREPHERTRAFTSALLEERVAMLPVPRQRRNCLAPLRNSVRPLVTALLREMMGMTISCITPVSWGEVFVPSRTVSVSSLLHIELLAVFKPTMSKSLDPWLTTDASLVTNYRCSRRDLRHRENLESLRNEWDEFCSGYMSQSFESRGHGRHAVD
jgi:hypothetical protein